MLRCVRTIRYLPSFFLAHTHTPFDSHLLHLGKKNPVVNAKNAIAQKVTHSPRASQTHEITPVIVIPKTSQRSKYSKQWEPYIAANLHLYTVPLAIFLRRARELDFSPREFRRSLSLVQRVFRVFSPEVVHAINALLQDSGATFASLVTKHNQALGGFSPAVLGRLTLSSCGQDMHNLLEEMYSQHFKAMRELNILDRFTAYMGIGEVTNSEEKELRAIVEKAKLIVKFPQDYEVLPTANKPTGADKASVAGHAKPERDRNGLLTEVGRRNVIDGNVKCTPADILYVGDKITMRPGSYEIPQLVNWTILASDFLNRRLGLVDEAVTDRPTADETQGTDEVSGFVTLLQKSRAKRTSWIRVNLRFLADYRNLVFIVLVTWFWARTRM